MAETAQKRSHMSSKDGWHQKIYEKYNELRSNEPNSKYMPKSYFYDLVADEFFLSSKYVAILIRKMIKGSK